MTNRIRTLMSCLSLALRSRGAGRNRDCGIPVPLRKPITIGNELVHPRGDAATNKRTPYKPSNFPTHPRANQDIARKMCLAECAADTAPRRKEQPKRPMFWVHPTESKGE